MHMLIYRSRQRSYRDLPLRLFELGTVYRFERSGVLHGLLRARGFTQDDSHIFCAPEQLAEELTSLLAFVLRVLRAFGFEDFEAELATRPEKFVGDPADWDHATDALREALEATEIPYAVAEGDLEYTAADNARHRPRVIHRALFGSLDRFFGILTEHHAGAFPAWLAPVQAHVLGVRNDHDELARAVHDRLRSEGFRAEWAPADEPLGARIRKAKLEKVPYVLVVGDDDAGAGTVGVNARGQDRPERGVPVDAFVERLRHEVEGRLGG
jgi:threonyl-tRNA synthetase